MIELEGLKNARAEICEKMKSHNLPIIIFGAGLMAAMVKDELEKFGVKISGYAVDSEYYKPNKTYLNRPIYNFAELEKTPDKYVFILGITDELNEGKRVLEFWQNKNIICYTMCNVFKYMNYDYILKNHDKFTETFEMLADDFSKKTMLAYLKVKLTGDAKYNFPVYVPNQYFNEITRGGYIDCGAYTGDTVEKFITWSGGNYKKIFAIEADPDNFAKLEKFVREKNYKDVEIFNCGVWHEKTQLTFNSDGNTSSGISAEGNVKISVDTIDNIVGDENIDFIKMDIEGAELNALRGAVKTIEKNKPTLAICVYHKIEDLITIPQFIKSICGDYEFYLRKHLINSDCELVLYAIKN